jgi:NADH dehydrogenase
MDSINRSKKEVYLKNKTNGGGELILPERVIPYDTLIIGVGSTSNDFGTSGVKQYAYSLDDLDSANLFHQTMLEKILQKEYCEKESGVFSVTIVGGGATGVELAAELTDTTKKLSQFGLHRLKSKPIQITVVNAAEQLLPGLAPKISLGAKAILEDRQVVILNSTKVVGIEKGITKVESNGVASDLPSDLIVWAAGVKSQDFLTRLDGLEVNRMNQLVVNQQLQTSDENIFAIGDCACVKWINAPKEGMNVPPRAQSAHQMSDYLINNLHKITSKEKVKGFVYKDFGSLISLGSGETVGTLMGFLQGKNLFIEGKVAKFMYMNLYHHHQIKINGFFPAMFLLLGKLIQNKFKPKVKLH